MNNWILQDKFKLPEQDQLNHLINDISKATSLKNFEFKKYINEILTIVFYFANDPWTTQKTILSKLNITKKELVSINKFIRENKLLQDLITNKGYGFKYWQSITPFCRNIKNALNNKFSYPMRIAFYPGVSCMYYCGFCGRNQKEKYPLDSLENGLKIFKKTISELDPNNTAISISGGLEPLTNPKLGEIVEFASKHGLRVPLITNGL
jgi:dTDP-4-amino-4,6-dideoxy-D-glucose ammonia-lyase